MTEWLSVLRLSPTKGCLTARATQTNDQRSENGQRDRGTLQLQPAARQTADALDKRRSLQSLSAVSPHLDRYWKSPNTENLPPQNPPPPSSASSTLTLPPSAPPTPSLHSCQEVTFWFLGFSFTASYRCGFNGNGYDESRKTITCGRGRTNSPTQL